MTALRQTLDVTVLDYLVEIDDQIWYSNCIPLEDYPKNFILSTDIRNNHDVTITTYLSIGHLYLEVDRYDNETSFNRKRSCVTQLPGQILQLKENVLRESIFITLLDKIKTTSRKQAKSHF